MINKIAISGGAGTGTTTLSKELLKLLPDWRYTNAGSIMRKFATEADMSLDAFLQHLKYSENTDIDKMIDNIFLEYVNNSSHEDLFEGRFVVPLLIVKQVKAHILKIVLCASDEVAAQRVAEREGIAYEDALEKNMIRNAVDLQRGKDLYGIDISKPQLYADLIFTTDNLSPKNMAMLLKSCISEKITQAL